MKRSYASSFFPIQLTPCSSSSVGWKIKIWRFNNPLLKTAGSAAHSPKTHGFDPPFRREFYNPKPKTLTNCKSCSCLEIMLELGDWKLRETWKCKTTQLLIRIDAIYAKSVYWRGDCSGKCNACSSDATRGKCGRLTWKPERGIFDAALGARRLILCLLNERGGGLSCVPTICWWCNDNVEQTNSLVMTPAEFGSRIYISS
jgi:hypothetical protein